MIFAIVVTVIELIAIYILWRQYRDDVFRRKK